jgi:hypothetical protein
MSRPTEASIQYENSQKNFFVVINRIDKDVHTKNTKLNILRLVDYNELEKNFNYYSQDSLEYDRSLYFEPESSLISGLKVLGRGKARTKDVSIDTIKKILINSENETDESKQVRIKNLALDFKMDIDKLNRVLYHNSHLEEIKKKGNLARLPEKKEIPEVEGRVRPVNNMTYGIKNLPSTIETPVNTKLNVESDDRIDIDKFTFAGFRGIIDGTYFIIDYAGRIYEIDGNSFKSLVKEKRVNGVRGEDMTITSTQQSKSQPDVFIEVPVIEYVMDFDPELNYERPEKGNNIDN